MIVGGIPVCPVLAGSISARALYIFSFSILRNFVMNENSSNVFVSILSSNYSETSLIRTSDKRFPHHSERTDALDCRTFSKSKEFVAASPTDLVISR